MSNYVVILCIAVGILFADEVSAQLRCRICDGAKYLDDCHTSASCSYDENCYMESRSIDGLHSQYWGGCRPKVICATLQSNKSEAAACSKCCARDDCNIVLCNLSKINNNTHCFSCPQGVDDIRNCNNVVTCADNEMCYSGKKIVETSVKHFVKCYEKEECKRLTMAAMNVMEGKEELPHIVGRKRETPVCDICCGSELCNILPCNNIKDRLYLYYKLGRLNNETLRLQIHHP